MGSEAVRRSTLRPLPPATSKDGYVFDPNENYWKLNKDCTVAIGVATSLLERAQRGFRQTLCRYAEELSAMHTYNMVERLKRMLRDTGATEITSAALLNWRSALGDSDQWQLGGLKGFLLAWYDYGFEGISKEVADLLIGLRISGNEKGVAVAGGCPETGPLTDVEMSALMAWLNSAVVRREIEFQDFAYFLSLVYTARRPTQLAALRGKDLVQKIRDGVSLYRIAVPRAKQRASGFRREFRSLAVTEDLYLVLMQQHRCSVASIEAITGRTLDPMLRVEVPVFVNITELPTGASRDQVSELLLGSRPDALHATTSSLSQALQRCARASTARSERTGEFIRLTATRFRRTRGTKLRREGFGAFVIAELLDHSDVQNVKVYTENAAQEAVVIDQYIGAQLAPFAQACMGRLVRSERDAIRGDDPRSRVPNHLQETVGTCGNYGFCASGFRACYTCFHFQPWIHGPHAEVLDELYREKARAKDAGCADVVVNANDMLILALEHCVLLCAHAKAADSTLPQEAP